MTHYSMKADTGRMGVTLPGGDQTEVVDLLPYGSVFFHVATPEEIECERTRIEAAHQDKIAVHEISFPTHSGRQATRVTWKRVP